LSFSDTSIRISPGASKPLVAIGFIQRLNISGNISSNRSKRVSAFIIDSFHTSETNWPGPSFPDPAMQA